MNIFAQVLIAALVVGGGESQKQQVAEQQSNIAQTVAGKGQSAVLDDKKEQKRIRDILERIAKKYGSMKRFQAKIHMFQYDSVFGVEKRGTGTLYFDAPGNTRWDISPLKKEFVSKRRTNDGKTYRNENLQHGTVIWRKDEVVFFNHDDKIVAKMGLVEKKAYEDFKEAKIIKYIFSNRHYFPLYFVNLPGKHLSKLTPEIILQRFRISIESESASFIKLKIVPTTKLDRTYSKLMRITVDKKSMLVTAQKIIHSTGNEEVVYVYSDFKFDNEFPLHADRLYPELSKYRDYKIIIIPSIVPIYATEGKDEKNKKAKSKK